MRKLIVILLLCLSAWSSGIGTIMVTKGSVDVLRNGENLPATNGMELLQKDEIITKSKSRTQIMLKDETVITIGPKSSFTFEEYAFDESGDSKLSVRANRGFFRSVTGRIGKVAPERFKVKTASATIGIRGTDFSGDITPDKEVFKCYSGGITVAFDGGLKDIDAGMMMELSAQKIEVKKIAAQKGDAPQSDTKKGKKSQQAKANKEQKNEGKATKSTPPQVVMPAISGDVVEEDVGGVDVAPEELQDVAEVANEIYIEEETTPQVDNPVDDDPIVDDTQGDDSVVDTPVTEPFEVTPGSEERQTLY